MAAGEDLQESQTLSYNHSENSLKSQNKSVSVHELKSRSQTNAKSA